ncbi:anti-sigma factor [Kribbella sp. VKM Ac-2566]|uniref:anti-sigma factor family protein n=1 Tax=Kribbella sp. VKM Ac-2566 TaxID=2512218 RepID=UPI001063CB25|nr:zf-HC2 domain-containing protein [Kribbella sp. VKM Ac-2566]TDX04055.1 putative zinc finger protein [Kribbella sp. VKM Ac-2566]
MTCPQADAIGLYVLGGLDTDERLEMERHIRACASCQDAVQQVAHLPGVLHSLTLEDVVALQLDDADPGEWQPLSISSAPASLPKAANVVPGDSSITRLRRASTRTLLAATAAVVLVVAGGLIGRQISDDPASPPQAEGGVTWSATDGVGGIDTQVQLSSRSWGTDIQIHMNDLAPGQRCMLVVYTRSGQSEATGWWTTSNIPEADVPASSSFALSDITRVDVVKADQTILASLTDATR